MIRPTASDLRTIRATALALSQRHGNSKRTVEIQAGYRCNIKHEGRPISINVLLVSDDPDWNDTDLSDFASWQDFTIGVRPDAAGNALVDLYLYEPARGGSGELCCNMQVRFDSAGLVAIDADSTKNIWTRS